MQQWIVFNPLQDAYEKQDMDVNRTAQGYLGMILDETLYKTKSMSELSTVETARYWVANHPQRASKSYRRRLPFDKENRKQCTESVSLSEIKVGSLLEVRRFL